MPATLIWPLMSGCVSFSFCLFLRNVPLLVFSILFGFVYFLGFVFWRESVEERNRFAGVADLGSGHAIVAHDAVVLEGVHRVDLVVALRVEIVL